MYSPSLSRRSSLLLRSDSARFPLSNTSRRGKEGRGGLLSSMIPSLRLILLVAVAGIAGYILRGAVEDLSRSPSGDSEVSRHDAVRMLKTLVVPKREHSASTTTTTTDNNETAMTTTTTTTYRSRSGAVHRTATAAPPPPKTVGDYRRAKLSTYLDQRRRQCDETNRWVSIDMPRAEILNSYTYGNHTAKYAHEERHLSMQRCEIEGIGGNDGWTVHRLGPYVGTGGYDWHQTYVHPLPGPAKAKFLTGKLCAPVSATGEILGYPPIYSHHVHTKLNGVEHVLESHGDTVCSEERGGKACYLHSYPQGFGMPFDPAGEDYLSLDFLQIDKREYPSPPMIFFQEIAVKWSADPSLRPVSSAMLHAKSTPGLPFATTMVAQRPSFLWNTGKWLAQGKVLISPEDQLPWFHAHKPYFHGMWAFAARPDQLGLTPDLLYPVDDQISPWTKPKDYDYVWAPDSENPMEDLRRKIESSEAGMASLRCFMRSSDSEKTLERVNETDSSSRYPEAWHQNWKGNWYDRAGEVHCDPWSFNKGDDYTIITLNGVHPQMRDQKIPSLQHNGFWLVYESTGDEVGPNYETYGTYISQPYENQVYHVASTWLKQNGTGEDAPWLAGGREFRQRYSYRSGFTNFTLSATPEYEMRQRMEQVSGHGYYDMARGVLKEKGRTSSVR